MDDGIRDADNHAMFMDCKYGVVIFSHVHRVNRRSDQVKVGTYRHLCSLLYEQRLITRIVEQDDPSHPT